MLQSPLSEALSYSTGTGSLPPQDGHVFPSVLNDEQYYISIICRKSCKRNNKEGSFQISFLPSQLGLRNHSKCLHVSTVCSFQLLSKITLCQSTTANSLAQLNTFELFQCLVRISKTTVNICVVLFVCT